MSCQALAFDSTRGGQIRVLDGRAWSKNKSLPMLSASWKAERIRLLPQ